jgi:hypothetical protein
LQWIQPNKADDRAANLSGPDPHAILLGCQQRRQRMHGTRQALQRQRWLQLSQAGEASVH